MLYRAKFIVALLRKEMADIVLLARENIYTELSNFEILAQLSDRLSAKNPISGGSRDTELNVPTTKPTRDPSFSTVVIAQTPVG